jgi:Domain of unknown function (DUF4337)
MAELELPNPDEVHEKAEKPFSKTVALAVAVYAVVLAFAAAGGHNVAKEMMMAKQEESNAWNRYQSKSTREALYRNEVIKLEAEKEAAGGTSPPARQKLLDRYLKEEARMKDDKKEIEEGNKDKHEKGARDYQTEVKQLQQKDPYFDFAEVMMQLGIVLASVAMLSGKKWAFALSLVLAVLGTLLTVNGFFLFDGGKLLGGH